MAHLIKSSTTLRIFSRENPEWESKTEDIEGVPHIDKWIAFMRKKATKASQQQKVVLQPAETPQLRYPKDKKKRPTKEGKVYASQGEATSNGDHDYKPSRSKSKQPKAAGYGRIQCTLCNSAHHVFQCKQFFGYDCDTKERAYSGCLSLLQLPKDWACSEGLSIILQMSAVQENTQYSSAHRVDINPCHC